MPVVKNPTIMLIPIIILVSLVLSLNCSAMTLDITKVGIADSKTVIFTKLSFSPKTSPKTKIKAGPINNL